MKDIKEYVLPIYKNHSKRQLYEWWIEDMQEYYDNDVPQDIIERIKNNEIVDYILENLNTHDNEKLKKKIEKYFGDKYKFYFEETLNFDNKGKEKNPKKSFYIVAKELTIEQMYNDEDFDNLLKFYGYFISNEHRPMSNYILVCPLYAESATKLVYDKCHGKVYHFTTKNNEDSILKNGLRCKKSSYRIFPERIYLYATNKKLGKRDKFFMDNILDPFDAKKYGVSILQIDLNKTGRNIEFYTDDYMEEKEAIYTYTNIPKECITKLDIEL